MADSTLHDRRLTAGLLLVFAAASSGNLWHAWNHDPQNTGGFWVFLAWTCLTLAILFFTPASQPSTPLVIGGIFLLILGNMGQFNGARNLALVLAAVSPIRHLSIQSPLVIAAFFGWMPFGALVLHNFSRVSPEAWRWLLFLLPGFVAVLITWSHSRKMHCADYS